MYNSRAGTCDVQKIEFREAVRMDDEKRFRTAIAQLFRDQQRQILQLRKELDKLKKFVGAPEDLESLVTLAEDEHKWEQIEATIKLLEHGKDPDARDA